MTDNEKIAALAAVIADVSIEREWYRAAWTEAFREREELRARLDSLKGSEDTTSAALAGALTDLRQCEKLVDSLRKEKQAARHDWSQAVNKHEEALEKLDAAETELEHANNSLAVLREDRDELGNELSQARNRLYSLEYNANKYKRQLEELREWSAAAQEDAARVREERDELRNWYQSVMEQAEEFGL